MAKNISNIFFFFNILLLLTFFISKCQNEIPTQTVEEKDQVKDVKKTEEEKKTIRCLFLNEGF